MSSMPAVTVAAITEVSGRFLLVEERIQRRLLFNQPAGHVERGETLRAAVVRETLEESAWRFEPDTLVGIYLYRRAAGTRDILRFAFAGTVSGHDPARRLDRGIIGTHWLTAGQMQEREARLRSPLVLRCVQDYLSGSRSPLEGVAELDLTSAAAVATAMTPLAHAVTPIGP